MIKQLTAGQGKGKKTHSLGFRKRKIGYILVAPAILILLLTTIYPTIYMFFVSFFRWSIIPTLPRQFIGLRQYLNIFQNPDLYGSIRATLLFVFLVVVVQFLLGLGLALLISNSRIRWLRVVFLMPAVIAPVVVGLIWRFMFSHDLGVINYLISAIGLEKIAWLGQPASAMASIMIVDIWQWTPFAMLIFLAGIESLPSESFEAAKVDGASVWQSFRFIMFPLLTPVMAIVLMFRSLDAFKTFDIIYMVTRGGPGASTNLLSHNIWRRAFFENNMGLAAALSVIMVILATVMTRFFIRLMSKTQGTL
ncbi:MAG TPA: sugar ABC transporter permease [Atribacteraceae bacterium]|nr:sugar ABC transporter permease [Atribacteraceae bacterium]